MKIHTIITGRSIERLEKAVQLIKEATKDDGADVKIEWMICDQSSLESVEAFATAFKKRKLPLHILVNNAGGFFYEPYFTQDGLEQHLAVNHIAHFYLTVLLLDLLKACGSKARVVTVSSLLHLAAYSTDWNSLAYKENPGLSGYATSKLANILFVRALGKRLKGSNVAAYVVHPGYSQTNGLTKPRGLLGYVTPMASKLVTTNAATGATAQIKAATDPAYEGRDDMSNIMIGPSIPLPFFFSQTSEWNLLHPLYVNDKEADKLWNWTCETLKHKRDYVVLC